MSKWISVKDKMPENDVRVIVCACTKKCTQSINMAYRANGSWHGNGSMANVTHWQPLPALPGESVGRG